MNAVFPVYAGVIPRRQIDCQEHPGVPRVCGGDPVDIWNLRGKSTCSPCMRGCYEVIIDKYMKKLMRHTV